MNAWFGESPTAFAVTLAVAVIVLFVLAATFLVLWLVSARRRRHETSRRADAELSQLNLDLLLAEQTARLRMVGEIHEVAVHSMTALIKQADGARYAGEAEPSAAVRSVAAIADTARSTLDDLRRVTAIVKHGEADPGPHPGIKTAHELFNVMREGGLDIRFEESGERFELKPGAELAIHGILQESLSNALKYGGQGAVVTVTFRWSEQGIQVLIDDDGIRAATRRNGLDPNEVARHGGYTVEDDAATLTDTPTGPGITEMRERAELFGGVLHASTVPGVGFSIAVVFPALRHDKAADPGAAKSRTTSDSYFGA